MPRNITGTKYVAGFEKKQINTKDTSAYKCFDIALQT